MQKKSLHREFRFDNCLTGLFFPQSFLQAHYSQKSLPFLVRYGTLVIAIIVSLLFVVVFCFRYDDLPLGQYLFPQLY